MKRPFVQFAAALLISSAPGLVDAQTTTGVQPASGGMTGGITGGIKGGITFGTIPEFADVLEDDEADVGMRIGLMGGGFAAMTFDDMFGVQVEALFVQKGLSYEFGGSDFDYRLDFIEIPVLLEIQTATDAGVYALVGPAFGFNVNAEAFSETDDAETTVDLSDETAGFEMSFVAAVGYQVNRFLIEGRYMEGLTNLLDDDVDDEITYKTRTFAVLAGFRF